MSERKTPAEKIEVLEARATVLKNRIAQLKARQKSFDRKHDARRKIIIGGTVLAEMHADPDFRVALLKILNRRVTRKMDKETLGDLLKD